jgi:isoquinoline 1-oxidoreductase subunit beta
MTQRSSASATRRDFLKGAGAVSTAALTVGFTWAGPARRAQAAATSAAMFSPNAFVRVGTDGSVTVISKHVEMGQGAYTGIATVLAEELDADWAQVKVESAPANAKLYANLAFGMQGTGGSSAMNNSWAQLREAGAKARSMLLTAASRQWAVPVTELTTDSGVVYHHPSGRQASYGSLSVKAAALPVPDKVALKDPKDFKLIGAKVARVDVPAKVNGTAQFTLDVTMPGMLVALLQRPPLFGATVASFSDTAALAVPGVVKVVQIHNGVAVIAKGFWAAKQGREALVIQWDDTHAEKRSSPAIIAEYRQLAMPQRRSKMRLIRFPGATNSRIWPTRPWSRSMRSSSSRPPAVRSGQATSSKP